MTTLQTCLIVALLLGLVACVPMPPRDEPEATPDGTTEAPAETAGTESVNDDPQPAVSSETDITEAPEPAAPEAPAAPPEQEMEAPESNKEAADSAPPSAAPPAPATLELVGRLTLAGGEADLTEAVIYFMPDERASSGQSVASTEARSIVTRDKMLTPTVTAVQPGAELSFPNEDPILHNLFSVSAGNGFDVGIYGPDETPSVTVESAGVVNIYCNVHHDMHAHVLVVDTPWRTRPDATGRFELDGLPAGPGTLHAWHRQTEGWSTRVTGSGEQSFDFSMQVTRPMLPAHRDKTGQPYNRRDRDPYR